MLQTSCQIKKTLHPILYHNTGEQHAKLAVVALHLCIYLVEGMMARLVPIKKEKELGLG